MKPTLDDAILLAVQTHRGQRDKYGQTYILHPLRVLLRLKTAEERIVGVLHDVVEDTRHKPNPVTLDDLRRMGYSKRVVAAIDSVTIRDGESYDDFIRRAKSNPLARQVKLADLQDNLDPKRMPARLTPREQRRTAKYRRAWAALKR
jgi:(p)ppGpp synthase/HD superfamily hydrolase